MKFNFYSLDQLCSKIIDNRGRTCPTAEDGLPLIATNCIKNDSLYPVFANIRYVDDETYRNWFRGHPEPNDIIFVCKGSPGRCCWVPDPVNFCIAQDMVAIRANQKLVDPKYLFALLRSSATQESILNMHVGTLIPHFKKGDFPNLYLKIPEDPLYQKEIGGIYFDFCLKVSNLENANQTLEAIAQAIFTSWFVDFEPVKAKAAVLAAGGSMDEAERAAMRVLAPALYATTTVQASSSRTAHSETGALSGTLDLRTLAAAFPSELVESELGLIPKGWVPTDLTTVSTLNPTSWSQKNHPDTVEYVDLANAKSGVIQETKTYPWTDCPSRARRSLEVHDTIVGTVRPGNKSFAYIGPSKHALTGSTGFAVLRPKESVWSEFIYLSATSELNIERLAHLADGGAYPAVRPELVAQTSMTTPSIDVVTAFHSISQPIFTFVDQGQAQSQILTALRDTLLPKLLSGELTPTEVAE